MFQPLQKEQQECADLACTLCAISILLLVFSHRKACRLPVTPSRPSPVHSVQVIRVGAFGDPEIQEYLVKELTRTRRLGPAGGTAPGHAATKEEGEDARLDPIVQAWLVTKASGCCRAHLPCSASCRILP